MRRQGRNLAEVTHHLGYLERLYPTSIGEACFIDAHGEEFARVVRGEVARAGDLSTEEEQAPFFAPTFALDFGQAHQTGPYISPDTKEWVIANATLIPQADGRKRAIVHFEVTVESFRRAMGATVAELRVIDARTGRVVIDGAQPQRVGAPLGVPDDRRFAGLRASAGERASPRWPVAARLPPHPLHRGQRQRLARRRERQGADRRLISGIGPAPLAMLAVALVIIVLGRRVAARGAPRARGPGDAPTR